MTARSIVDELKSAYVGLREDVRARWKRDLPFSELVFDRWRARPLKTCRSESCPRSARC